MTRLFAGLTAIAIAGAASGIARADVTDELFVATVQFEQAYLGNVLLDEGVRGDSYPTLGGSLRLELLLGKWVAVGVEGAAIWFRQSGNPLIPAMGAAEPTQLDFDDGRHLILGGNGVVRVRFGLANGLGEYYFVGGGGPAWLMHDTTDPSAYGTGISGNSALGWTAHIRFGMRGELVPGLGGLVEIGWMHREHTGAFSYTQLVGGSPTVAQLDYITNQLSLTFGWYVSR